MIKLIVTFLVCSIASSAFAYNNHDRPRDRHDRKDIHIHNHHHKYDKDRWIAPLVGGIIIGSVLSKQNEVVVDERPIYVAPPQTTAQYPVGPQFYNCLVRVYDQNTNTFRNEVMTCVR